MSKPFSRSRSVLLVAALCVIFGALTVPQSAAAATAGGPRPAWVFVTMIENVNSHKCLEMPWATRDNFAQAGQYTCHGGDNQQWAYNPDTGEIRNIHSGKCLEDMYYSTDNFAPIGQYDCTGGVNQMWWMGDSTGLIENQFSMKCLEVLDYRTDDFAPVDQYDCYAGSTQLWLWND
jgi:hypothetical protein